jgi:hypothetical protein
MQASYKNLIIIGGFLFLYRTGAGKNAIDAFWGAAAPGRRRHRMRRAFESRRDADFQAEFETGLTI